MCDCGKECIKKISTITTGNTLSCGRCSELSAEELTGKKFGSLVMVNPKTMLFGAREKVEWVCDCGKRKFIKFYAVMSGGTTSCGKCSELSAEELTGKKRWVFDFSL